MKKLLLFITVFIFSLCIARAAIVINFTESGLDVVVDVSGSLTTLPASPGAGSAGANVLVGAFAVQAWGVGQGTSGDTYEDSDFTAYSVTITQDIDFSQAWDSSLGTVQSVLWNSERIFLTSGYSANDPINYSVTLENTSFTSMGLSVGTIAELGFSTISGSDTITLVAVPEPSSYAILIAAGMLTAVLFRRRA